MGIRITCKAFNKAVRPHSPDSQPSNLVSLKRDIEACILISTSYDSDACCPHHLRNAVLSNTEKKIQCRIAVFANNPYIRDPDMDK